MSDAIDAFLQLLEGRLGLHPEIVAAAALVIVLVLAFLSLYLSSKLRSTREIIAQLGKRLGYEPPYGDGTEIFHQEFRKEIVERAREVKIKHLEQRATDLEAEAIKKDASLAAQQQRSTELEEQLRHASLRNEEATVQAGEQAQALRETVEQLEQRIRQMDAESNANRAAHHQYSKEVEEQLQQASLRNENILAQAAEQERTHRTTVQQFEQRVRDLEAESVASLAALQQRAKELEEQLRQASLRNEEITGQASEKAQAHRATVEYFEQRIRDLEAASNASLTTLEQRAKELEEQLQQATIQNENERSIVQRETLEQIAEMEQLELRARELDVELNARGAALATLQTRVNELESQLQQAADQTTEAVLAPESAPPLTVEQNESAVSTSEQFLRRAEWITACAVGAIRLHGLVAAEAYAAAAIAADKQNQEARHLLAELVELRRASGKPSPSVAEAVTTFDEKAAGLFGADLARAADIAEREAFERYRAGFNRSALLAVNLNLALRQETAANYSPRTPMLQEMRSVLLARLAGNGRPSNTSLEFAAF